MKHAEYRTTFLSSILLASIIGLSIITVQAPLGLSTADNASGADRSFDFSNLRSLMGYVRTNGDFVQLVIGIPEDLSTHAFYDYASRISDRGGRVVKTISIGNKPTALVIETPLESTASFATEVKSTLQPRYIEPNFKYEVSFSPNDYYWPNQWGPRKIEADWAWNTTLGSHDILVAVSDTGIDYTHPDLAANYVPLGYDWVNNDNDPLDDFGHGTHCAGIIASTINNTIGVAGLAQVRIMAEKALDEDGGGYADDLANSITHAANAGADIISMSWGGSMYSYLIHDAIKSAHDTGVLLVAAAGNEGYPGKGYPAGYDEVIAVTATDENDQPASFTSYGYWVELAAPGVNIYSTMPTYWVTMNQWGYSMYYSYMSGTSMACPHVAGLAALVWSRFPTMTRDQLRYYLRSTADDLGIPGFDDYYGYGRINARKAIEQGLPSHDLVLWNWYRPPYVKAAWLTVNATVLNLGSSTETSVQAKLYVNGSDYGTRTISSLASGSEGTVSWNWWPSVGNVYNLTVYILPKPEEASTENNKAQGYVWSQTGVVKVPECYAHIQQGVDVAVNDDKIIVAPGIYEELICVYKPKLSLIGENRWTTIVDGCGEGFWGFSVQSSETTISKFTVRNTYLQIGLPCAGIIMSSASNNTITDNYVSGNFEGILMWGTSGNTIARNVVATSQDCGIAGLGGSYTAIKENIVKSNEQFDIALVLGSNYNSVCNNTVTNTVLYDGIWLAISDGNTVIDNNLLQNPGAGYGPSDPYGFAVDCSMASDSIIKNNYVANNTRGIYVDSGSSNNRIYHNNFINNTVQAINEAGTNNVWSDRWACEGNYWTDYVGTDQDNDGVGDTNLPHQGIDNYPLLSYWYTSDLNHDGQTDIRDIVKVAAAYGSHPGDPTWNPHADVNEDGVIDDLDINLTVPEFGMTWQTWWNKTLTVLAMDPGNNSLTNIQVRIDEQAAGSAGTGFNRLKGPHQVQVQQTYSDGTHNYTFSRWEDGSIENPRILIMNTSTTITAYYTLINNPPATPSAPNGPSTGYVYTNCAFTTSTTDPDNDNLYYQFNWDDGATSTVGPYASGAIASSDHQWTRPKTYKVRAIAQDAHGAWSGWSANSSITLNQNDAGKGVDAGNTFSSALYISPYSYKGTVYKQDPIDQQDYYQFEAYTDERIHTTMTPPPNGDFDLQLYDPNGNLRATSKLGINQTDSITFYPDIDGNWRICIYYASGTDGQCSFRVQVTPISGCPYLYVNNGKEYVNQGLLDIHDSTGADVNSLFTLFTMPKRVKGTYELRLVEHPKTHSSIDQVKLFAVLEDKTIVQLQLLSAVHSDYGNVLPQLLLSDDVKVELLGADFNKGTSQSIELKFLALPPNIETIGFFFTIEGNNRIIKPIPE
jgi:thermitase